MTTTLNYRGTLTVTKCWCGIPVGIPSELYRAMQADSNQNAHCPIGHTFVFGKNATDCANERADNLERRLQRAEGREAALRDQLGASERTAAALRGWITRYRNHIAAGVCPVEGCKRNFANVKGHIERMHPDWIHAHPEVME